MRIRRKKAGLSVQAISGSHVVLLGLDIAREALGGQLGQLLGFAIYRKDHTEKEEYWLKGFKTFKETAPDLKPGALVSTREHPVQAFLWGDYTAKPKHSYTYRAVAIYGTPDDLREGASVEVDVSTEDEDLGKHAVYFNRGAGASQAYAWKFKNKAPKDVPNREAYKWLSRGLEEAIIKFIGQAGGEDFALRAAVYEFSYEPVLRAFKEAAARGADVKIIYDAREGKNKPVAATEKAIKKTGIRNLTIKRTADPSYISHNKFIVLLKHGVPCEVWTGSTNFTEGGIFGQSNVGHIVRDQDVARKYFDYWRLLKEDPDAKSLRNWNDAQTPVPDSVPPKKPITPLFSPRNSLEALDWYTQCIDKAQKRVCFTAAFGINTLFTDVLDEDGTALRYILVEKADDNIDMIRRVGSNRIAVGSTVQTDGFHRWLSEKLTDLNVHVRYVHTKYMLKDPLSDNPIVISGSANFSDASTRKNDENMLVITGDKTVADIYLGEFMRLFNHYYYRDIVNRQSQAQGTKKRESAFLKPDNSWAKPYFETANPKCNEKNLFC